MGEKLLIVDDENDVREWAAKFFRKRKIEVLTASNGEDAIDIVNKDRPAAMLLDITMEGIDGIETLRRVREVDKDIKVVMVTGSEDKDAMNQTRELGAYDYIHKPLKMSELESVVLKIFEKEKNEKKD